ncbi:MAG: glutaminyl-peptide cyclotransferase [Brevundimonas sp.]|uniref:glutaminyl-peptide cyclotransferase n=1 Tax=Brevundimonas sp. TaxID=1871086 RepID=UPI0040349859
MTRPNRRSGWIAALVGSVVLQAAPVVAQAPVQTPAPAPAAPPIARYGYEVVATYPHDPSAFTQGLVIADGVLTESTGRHPSSVRRVRLSDGEVLTRRDLDPALFGEGLTVMGDRAFSLTWTDGKIFVWNAADLTPVGEHPLAGQGWGLTHDGTRLILSDGEPHLRFLDPTTLAETGSVPVTIGGRPLGRLNELEFIDDEVWANVWQTDFIVRINPATGNVTGVIDLTGLLSEPVRDPADDVLNGIAWDAANRRLFVTGKNWPRLFEIRVVAR